MSAVYLCIVSLTEGDEGLWPTGRAPRAILNAPHLPLLKAQAVAPPYAACSHGVLVVLVVAPSHRWQLYCSSMRAKICWGARGIAQCGGRVAFGARLSFDGSCFALLRGARVGSAPVSSCRITAR